MEQLIMILVLVLVFAVIVWGIIYTCRTLSVPLFGQWAVAAVIIIVLLYALVHMVNGGSLRLPR